MIVLGILQLITGTMLIIAGWLLMGPPHNDHLFWGIACMSLGIYTVSTCIKRIDPPGV